MKIAIVVHGRFHAFDLAHALLKREHEVTLFTNYPAWAVKRFGISSAHVRSFWPQGIASRLALRISQKTLLPYPEAWLHILFGRWAAARLRKQSWDVIHYWSGVGEELLRQPSPSGTLRLMMRGSTHIQVQAKLLLEEEQRVGVQLDRPSPWMIAREEHEYDLASAILVISQFAYDSFVAEGIHPQKLSILLMAAQLRMFRPTRDVITTRCQRILSGAPLRVLYVGTISFRKGFWDLAAIIHRLAGDHFRFQSVGACAPEVASLVQELHGLAEFIPKQPQASLPHWYAENDLFIFPTIEDGYAVVLAQASAGALPIMTTTNCGGPDLIRENETGWVLPIRNPEAFIERLHWCDAHRQELVDMIWRIYHDYQSRDWDDVAVDFERICQDARNQEIPPVAM